MDLYKLQLSCLLALSLFSCEIKQNSKSLASEKTLNIEDSLLLANTDSVLFLPGYVYAERDFYYYLNVRPPFTTHKYSSRGAFLGYYNGSGSGKDDLPFFANGLVPIDKDRISFITGALMHVVFYNERGEQVKKMFVTDSLSEPVFSKFRMSNDTHVAYYDDGLIIIPLENNTLTHYDPEYYSDNTIGIVDTTGVMLNSFGGYDPLFNKKILPYRSVPLLAVDKKNDYIFNSFGAASKIYKYDYGGNLISIFGEQGQQIDNHNFPEQPHDDGELWTSNWLSTPIYNSMYYDNHRELLYRIYAVDTPKSEIEKLGNLLDKDAYLQIYDKDNLIGEIKLPTSFRWKIVNIDNEGHLYFASKYYYDQEEEQETWIYKVGLPSPF